MTMTSSPIDESQDASWMPTVFGGQPRIDALTAFLTAVKKEGCCLLVVSWHSKALISRSLDAIGLLGFIDQIYDKEDLEKKGSPKQNCSKALVMQEILSRLGIGGQRAVFVDSVKAQLDTVPCSRYFVESQHGLMQEDMDAICKILHVPPPGLSKSSVLSGLQEDE